MTERSTEQDMVMELLDKVEERTIELEDDELDFLEQLEQIETVDEFTEDERQKLGALYSQYVG